MSPRRIAAVVLPELCCELARRERSASPDATRRPLGVILVEQGVAIRSEVPARGERAHAEASPPAGGARLDAVNEAARARGIHPGQRVAEACALSGELELAYVEARAVGCALATVAEVALGFGVTVALALEGGIAPGDVVWVDVTGSAHLFGGEAALARELTRRVLEAGHEARIGIGPGPCIAELCARGGVGESELFGLPVASLFSLVASGPVRQATLRSSRGASTKGGAAPASVASRAAALFAKLGVVRLGELARLERPQLLARLEVLVGSASARGGIGAREMSGWFEGLDRRSLEPYAPPEILVESAMFDDGVASAPQLLFVLRGMISRASARLGGRAQAANRLELRLDCDLGMLAARRGLRTIDPAAARLVLAVELPAPLSRESDLLRALKAKLESLELEAPAKSIELEVSRIVQAPRIQLDLSRDQSVHPDALPALLSELSAEIGPEHVGVLVPVEHHLPEQQTALRPVHDAHARSAHARGASARGVAWHASGHVPVLRGEPSRVFRAPSPIVFEASPHGRAGLNSGASIVVGGERFECSGLQFDRRVDGIAWWTGLSSSRDLYRVRLRALSSAGAASDVAVIDAVMGEAWVGVDRMAGSAIIIGHWE
jgi:protein ImuB